LNIDVLCTVSSWERPIGAFAPHQLKSKPHRFGKQKRRFDSPRRQFRAFCPVAFIFSERRARMVNRWCAAAGARSTAISGVNLKLNRLRLKLAGVNA
jgi:hypothetical protein